MVYTFIFQAYVNAVVVTKLEALLNLKPLFATMDFYETMQMEDTTTI